MNIIHTIIIAVALLVMNTENGFAATNLLKLEEGQVVSGDVSVKGGRTVPLPDGPWVVAGRKDHKGKKGKYPWTQVILAQVQDRVITRVIRLSSGEALPQNGYKAFKACSGNYTLHENTVINKNKGDQNCLVVRPWCTRKREKNDNDFYRKALRNLAVKNGYYQPAALIGWQQRLADKKHSLVYWVGINTDLLLDPSKTERGMWIWDDWKPEAVSKSRPKQAVVELIKGWAGDWHQTLVARW